jgi:hypothetical protein
LQRVGWLLQELRVIPLRHGKPRPD